MCDKSCVTQGQTKIQSLQEGEGGAIPEEVTPVEPSGKVLRRDHMTSEL